MSNEQLRETVAIFNEANDRGTVILDERIKTNTYYRGYLFRKKILDLIPRGARILDYGCGSGRIAWLLAQEGYSVHGIDPAEKSIRDAKQLENKGLALTFDVLQDNGESLAARYYDAIVCSSAIEFIPDPTVVLTNLKRALKPSGRLIISFPNRLSIWRLYAKIRFGKRYKHLSVQWHVWTLRSFKSLLKENGFKPGAHVYFESAFDGYGSLRLLNRFFWVGTLCLVEATALKN